MPNKKTFKQLQKEEGLQRLKALKVNDSVIEGYKNDVLFYSERQNALFNATLLWVENEQRYVDEIKDFEEQSGCKVYHAQLTHMRYGDCLSLLYVSREKDEWEMERADLEEKNVMAYVINLDDDNCSEFGYIRIEPSYGGVARIN